MLRLDPQELRLVNEPYLLERGYIQRTARGREATAKARLHYGDGRSEAGSALSRRPSSDYNGNRAMS